ncbi:MAG TPA: phosphoesterase [Methanomicrobiales archaeon]|nr:phosphoesterase [Methanomicrobiales archaeon]
MGRPGLKGRYSADELKEAIRSRRAKVVHLTHNDLDAAGADAIHRMKYGEVFTIWASVGNFPHLLSAISEVKGGGDLLSITDLGYQAGIERWLKKARDAGWRIEWRDHHRWEDREAGIIRPLAALLSLDTATCATGIVARDLAGSDSRAAEIARVVCDYDLWRNEDPRSMILGRILWKPGLRDYVRDRLVEGVFADALIREEYDKIVAEMDQDIRKSIRYTRLTGKRYRIAFSPLYGYPSDTASRVRESFGSEIEVLVSSNGRFSLRSVPPVSHLIARRFGGGGHPHASGGAFPFTLLDRVTFVLFKRSRHFEDLVAVAESIGE